MTLTFFLQSFARGINERAEDYFNTAQVDDFKISRLKFEEEYVGQLGELVYTACCQCRSPLEDGFRTHRNRSTAMSYRINHASR